MVIHPVDISHLSIHFVQVAFTFPEQQYTGQRALLQKLCKNVVCLFYSAPLSCLICDVINIFELFGYLCLRYLLVIK